LSDTDKADQLLGKADALLGRYRHGAPATLSDASTDFPVLTEVVELPADPVTTTAESPEPAGAGADAEMDTVQLREQILATLAPELEKRLTDTLKPRTAELLDYAMQTVQLELGLSIRAAVRSAVAEAVDEALAARHHGTNANKR
jgi:hypothetical protein